MPDSMKMVGRISRLQVQRSGLKVKHPEPHYNPEPLLSVREAILSGEGVVGLTETELQVMDVHHAGHPDTRSVGTSNSVSVGFSRHYEQMRQKFGAHIVDGIAGENMLIEAERSWTLDDLSNGIVIQSAATGQLIGLKVIIAATPCVEFSTFCAQQSAPLSAQHLKETLQFLGDGMRGFYCSLALQQEPATVRVGDEIYLGGISE